jgi:mannitol-1-phosphate 5-dehydrogenase
VPGLVLKDNFAAYVDRKLFIHNLGHATAAYHGYLAGKEFIPQCMADPAIRGEARAAMWASAQALIARYPQEFNVANQEEHVEDLLRRFANRALNDSVFRVGRDLYRKLAPDDRCVGALRLVASVGGGCSPICRGIAAALRFKAVDEAGKMLPDDEKFHRELAQRGGEAVLESVCGLRRPADAEAIDAILSHYAAIG